MAGQIQPGEAVADATGPNASLEFGQASQMQQMAGQLKNDAPGAYRASSVPNAQGQQMQQGPPGPMGNMGGAMPQQGQQPPMNAQQPPPRSPITQQDALPGGKVFSQPRLQPQQGWRQDLRLAAQHPNAGPWLRSLALMLDHQETGQQRQASVPPSQGNPPNVTQSPGQQPR